MSAIKAYLYSLAFPYLCKLYGIKVATTKEEKEKIFKFRYEIYRVELSYKFLDDKLTKEDMLFDNDDFAKNSVIVYAGDINNITGTFRITVWDKENLPKRVKNKYYITEDILSKINHIGEYRFFQIRKDYRNSLLGLVLLSYTCEAEVEHLNTASDLIFSDAQPGLLKLYFSLGGFAYTDKMIFEEYDLLQVPFAIALYDVDYMKAIKSIAYHHVEYYRNLYKKKVSEKTYNKLLKDFRSNIKTVSLFVSLQEMIKYRYTLSSEKAKERFDIIVSLQKEILVLPIKKATTIIKKDMVDFDMFLLLEGKVGIFLNDKSIAELLPGDVFGEMALVSEHRKRFTNVKALTSAKIALIPRKILSQLEAKNPKLANKFLHLICDILNEKLAVSNKALVKLQSVDIDTEKESI